MLKIRSCSIKKTGAEIYYSAGKHSIPQTGPSTFRLPRRLFFEGQNRGQSGDISLRIPRRQAELPLQVLKNLPEMISVDGKPDGHLKVIRILQGPEEECPVMDSSPAQNPDMPDRFEKGPDFAQVQTELFGRRQMVILQKTFDAMAVVPLGINGLEHFLITPDQVVGAHFRDKIDRAVSVVAGRYLQQPLFLHKPLEQFGAPRGIEKAHHGRHDAAVLDKMDDRIENGCVIMVKAKNKPALHLQSESLDLLHARQQIPAAVLHLVAFTQTFLVGSFDADKDTVEAGLDHQAHQFFVIGQVDGGLGVEGKGIRAWLPSIE